MRVKGMLVYSGGIAEEGPDLHFGAVSHQAPEDDLYVQRCITWGERSQKIAGVVLLAAASPKIGVLPNSLAFRYRMVKLD